MMFSQDELIAIEELEKLSTEDLINQIKDISLCAWNNRLEVLTIRAWLVNFTGKFFNNQRAEQNLALWLALHFVFYTDQDVRALSKNLWWKFVHQRLSEYSSSGFMSDNTLEEKYNYLIDNTVVQPLGNCGGSGTNVCYFFRQSNGLKKELFEFKENEKYQYLVLVDDATVSGHQAVEYLDTYKGIENKKKYILTYIATDKAKEYIGDRADVISSINLDAKSKCFDDCSYIFSRHKNWTNVAKKMCRHYGQKLDPYNPIGYRNGQYTFGFYYNIPNNSLPIFWGTLGGWTPLFDRYFSDYKYLEDLNSEKFY